MYGDLLLDQLGVNFLGPAPLDLELLHMLTTFRWNALGSTPGWWFCHNNTVSCNENFWVGQVTPPPPLRKDKGWGTTRGGGLPKCRGFHGEYFDTILQPPGGGVDPSVIRNPPPSREEAGGRPSGGGGGPGQTPTYGYKDDECDAMITLTRHKWGQNCCKRKILLPISKAPRRGREHNRSISQIVTKSFRSPPSPPSNTQKGCK